MSGKDAMNNRKRQLFIQIEVNIVNSFSCFLIGFLQQSIKFHWLKI